MPMTTPSLLRRRARVAALLALIASGAVLGTRAAGPTYFPDDPIRREPSSQDASGVAEWDIPLSYDLALNLFARPGDLRDVRAMDVNTADEVPDSEWFTNRVPGTTLTADALARGPVTHDGPAPGRFTVVRAKPAGVSPGFVVRDSKNVLWFVQFDAAKYPGAASAASMIANRLFWALGYWQVEYHLGRLKLDDLDIGEKALVETPSGKTRKLDKADLQRVLDNAAKDADGSYRMLASRGVDGKPLGGFKYTGTRPDDPNDTIPHEHRRVLRALKVFGAWTNLVDMKAGNTLDVLETRENGHKIVRHYLQDVGSTFGTGALGPREWDEGYEYLFEKDLTLKRFLFGLPIKPWQTVPYNEYPEIGRFSAEAFVPEAWVPRVPTTAIRNARADDTFWAARRVMAFSDDMIRELVKVGRLSDPAAANELAAVLMQRRDRIGQAYYAAIAPLADFALDAGGSLTFVNEATRSRVLPNTTTGYTARWARFDNATGTATPFGESSSQAEARLQAPAGLGSTPGSFVQVELTCTSTTYPAWQQPVRLHFRRDASGWALVGVQRTTPTLDPKLER
jgi:hypothetical protein